MKRKEEKKTEYWHFTASSTHTHLAARNMLWMDGEAPRMSKNLTHVNRPGGVTILLSSLEFKYAFHAQAISAYINTSAKCPQ